jgi:hypothetical protein
MTTGSINMLHLAKQYLVIKVGFITNLLHG